MTGDVDTQYDVTVYEVDLFDAPPATLQRLKAEGRRVICYFSAGSSENWRADFRRFQAEDMSLPLDGWPGERRLDTRRANVREIMKSRLDFAVAAGCDGIDADNVDGYTNGTGKPLTAEAQLDYNEFLATQAHARGLAIGLKNDGDQLEALEPYFDFTTNEQCHFYKECADYRFFTNKGNQVFNIEYASEWVKDANRRDALCASSRADNLRTFVLPWR